MATFGTLTAVVGFVAQFVGLRALHWSATIFQLGVLLIMTITRSWVRRGLAADPEFYELMDGHELPWVVLYILNNNKKGWSAEKGITLKSPMIESMRVSNTVVASRIQQQECHNPRSPKSPKATNRVRWGHRHRNRDFWNGLSRKDSPT